MVSWPRVGVVREAGAGLHAEVVQHQERREVAQLGRADGAADARTCAFRLLDGEKDLLDSARHRHVCCDQFGARW